MHVQILEPDSSETFGIEVPHERANKIERSLTGKEKQPFGLWTSIVTWLFKAFIETFKVMYQDVQTQMERRAKFHYLFNTYVFHGTCHKSISPDCDWDCDSLVLLSFENHHNQCAQFPWAQCPWAECPCLGTRWRPWPDGTCVLGVVVSERSASAQAPVWTQPNSHPKRENTRDLATSF